MDGNARFDGPSGGESHILKFEGRYLNPLRESRNTRSVVPRSTDVVTDGCCWSFAGRIEEAAADVERHASKGEHASELTTTEYGDRTPMGGIHVGFRGSGRASTASV